MALSAESRRTNSLGSAESDCHTCAASRTQCDRRRPFCAVCTAAGARCHGYAMRLDWQPRASRRGPKQKTLSAPPRRPPQRPPQSPKAAASAAPSEPVLFQFIDENDPNRARRRGRKPGARTVGLRRAASAAAPSAGESVRERRPSVEGQAGKERPAQDVQLDSSDMQLDSSDMQLAALTLGWSLSPHPLSVEASQTISLYEQQFSFCTLTYYDVPTNPWRSCLPMAFDSPFLMDGILALGKRFRARLLCETEGCEVIELKDRALRGFSSTLGQADVKVLVATILVLVGLEYAESGYSHWFVHLSGALNVIAASGGIQVARLDPALRCQIAMLAWYDVTAALLSRRRPLFPRSYMESISQWRAGDEWSLMALNGYPDELFADIYDVAVAAAATSHLGADEQLALERRLWVAQPRAAGGDHSSLLECWRFGLLLFCARVFKTPSLDPFGRAGGADGVDGASGEAAHPSFWRPAGSDTASRCKSYADEILHVVAGLPAYSNVQKQCLIPVLLAGCELTGSPDQAAQRALVADYFQRWDRVCGIGPFRTALSVTRTVWSLLDSGIIADDAWWADVVMEMTGMRPDAGGTPGKEWLFG